MAKKLIEYIVNTLVDKPQLVKIEELEAEGKHIIQVKVAPSDLPRLIGKEGRVFRALRSVVTVVNAKTPADIVVDTDSSNKK